MTENRRRPVGPDGVVRPFVPPQRLEGLEQIAQALDHIAYVLSAIDHNLEALTRHMLDKEYPPR